MQHPTEFGHDGGCSDTETSSQPNKERTGLPQPPHCSLSAHPWQDRSDDNKTAVTPKDPRSRFTALVSQQGFLSPPAANISHIFAGSPTPRLPLLRPGPSRPGSSCPWASARPGSCWRSPRDPPGPSQTSRHRQHPRTLANFVGGTTMMHHHLSFATLPPAEDVPSPPARHVPTLSWVLQLLIATGSLRLLHCCAFGSLSSLAGSTSTTSTMPPLSSCLHRYIFFLRARETDREERRGHWQARGALLLCPCWLVPVTEWRSKAVNAG